MPDGVAVCALLAFFRDDRVSIFRRVFVARWRRFVNLNRRNQTTRRERSRWPRRFGKLCLQN